MALSRHDPGRFIGANLQVARTFNGFTLGGLGERIGTTHSAIANYESCVRQPKPDVLDALSAVLGFDKPFFFTPLESVFNDELYNFRKRQSTPLYMRNRAIAHIILFASLIAFFDEVVDLPKPDIPRFRCTAADEAERAAEIESAAAACRAHWSLGDRPVSSFTHLIENAGAVVTRFDMSEDHEGHVDAFSTEAMRPIVVVNAMKGASRTIFDVAHELGHLVLHGGMVSGTKELEEQADRFASAFVLPRAAMFREFPRPHDGRIDWTAMLAFKSRWRVSLQATFRRARDLCIIDAAIYTKAFKHISWRGWRKDEPSEPALELPGVVPGCFEALEAEYGQTPADIARQLHWHPRIMAMVQGGAAITEEAALRPGEGFVFSSAGSPQMTLPLVHEPPVAPLVAPLSEGRGAEVKFLDFEARRRGRRA